MFCVVLDKGVNRVSCSRSAGDVSGFKAINPKGCLAQKGIWDDLLDYQTSLNEAEGVEDFALLFIFGNCLQMGRISRRLAIFCRVGRPLKQLFLLAEVYIARQGRLNLQNIKIRLVAEDVSIYPAITMNQRVLPSLNSAICVG